MMKSVQCIWATVMTVAVLYSSFADVLSSTVTVSTLTTSVSVSENYTVTNEVSTSPSGPMSDSTTMTGNITRTSESTPSSSETSAPSLSITGSPSGPMSDSTTMTGNITRTSESSPSSSETSALSASMTGSASTQATSPTMSGSTTDNSSSTLPASTATSFSDTTTNASSPSESYNSSTASTANDSGSTFSVTSTDSVQSSSDTSVFPSSTISTPSALPSDNSTATATFSAVETSTSATQPTSTPATTPRPATQYPTAVPSDLYVVNLTIGTTSGGIYCKVQCNSSSLLEEIKQAFAKIPGFVTVRLLQNSANTPSRRKRAATGDLLQFLVVFEAKILISTSAEQRLNTTREALANISSLDSTSFNSSSFYRAMMNPSLTCPTGFTYTNDYTCHSLCEDFYSKCGEHGDCKVNIDLRSSDAQPYCLCKEDNDYEYSGPTCSESRMNRSKVIQIVAGVLGAFSGLCLVIIVALLCQRYRDDDNNKYSFNGYSNNGFSSGTDIDMMKMAA